MVSENEFLSFLIECFGVTENVSPETRISELGFDSLSILELAMTVERKYNTKLPLRIIEKDVRLLEIIELINNDNNNA